LFPSFLLFFVPKVLDLDEKQRQFAPGMCHFSLSKVSLCPEKNEPFYVQANSLPNGLSLFLAGN
jgi:hypothetical protein